MHNYFHFFWEYQVLELYGHNTYKFYKKLSDISSKGYVILCHSTNSVCEFWLPHILPAFDVLSLSFSHFCGFLVKYPVILDGISLMAKDVEHYFRCLIGLHILPYMK